MNEDQNGKDERKIRILTNEYTILRSSNEEEGSCSSVVMSSDTISNVTKKNVTQIMNKDNNSFYILLHTKITLRTPKHKLDCAVKNIISLCRPAWPTISKPLALA